MNIKLLFITESASIELDIRSDMFRRWIKEYRTKKIEAFQGSEHTSKPKDKKLSELQKLKKAI